MGSSAMLTLLFIASLLLCRIEAAPGRVVQLVAENPSPFVSADPNDPKYIISLFNDDETAAAGAVAADVPSLRSMIMTNAAGRQYNCSVPGSPAAAAAATALSQLDPDTTPAYNLIKSPHELLESLAGMCMYRQDGLWTYEVCHRQHVRQFRQVSLDPGSVVTLPVDANVDELVDAVISGDATKFNKMLAGLLPKLESGKKAEDFSCGKYTGDDKQNEAVREDPSSSGHPIKYVSHKYGGGAKCVLTGQPRTAEVRYTCLRDTQENVVVSVREFPTCNYVVVVSTPFLCKHPAFTPTAEDLRLVSCVPLELSSTTTKAATGSASDKAAAGEQDTTTAAATEGSEKLQGLKTTQSDAAKQKRKYMPSPAYVEDDGDDTTNVVQQQHHEHQQQNEEEDTHDVDDVVPDDIDEDVDDETDDDKMEASDLANDGNQDDVAVESEAVGVSASKQDDKKQQLRQQQQQHQHAAEQPPQQQQKQQQQQQHDQSPDRGERQDSGKAQHSQNKDEL